MASKKSTKKVLKIVLDTNALYTKMASDLVSLETKGLINDNKNHLDLIIEWFMPLTVIEERAFQMRKAASELLPNLTKIEKILGHNLGINETTLDARIDGIIQDNINSLGISHLKMDIGRIDWGVLIEAAHRRHPPFDRQNEKGFRDSLIVESFLQLVEDSPKSPSKCRLILVTNDELMSKAVNLRLSGSSNARVLNSLEELQGLINTLVSQVDETVINKLQDKATPFFFKAGEGQQGLYFSQKIAEVAQDKFISEFSGLPDGADYREVAGILIAKPRFIKKVGQRVHWASRVIFKAKAFANDPVEPQFSSLQLGGLSVGQSPPSLFGGGLPALLRAGKPRQTHIGATNIDVEWSVTVDSKSKLSRATIDNLTYVGTDWV